MQDTTDSTALYKASILNIHSVTALITHALSLTGLAVTLNTAYSTLAVAIHQAYIALHSRDCDAALAGGVSIEVPAYRGYEYHEGMINVRNGVCRPFDSQVPSAVTSDGLGMLLLKHLGDALADRDCIYDVIKGSAVSNDGSNKVGYAASNMTGQSAVIRISLRRAGFDSDSVGLAKAHGTGTALGDPIELRALNEVSGPTPVPFCVISALKSNIGHLSSTAGVAGVTKTTLALHYRVLPSTAHFRQLNLAINLSRSTLYVNRQIQPQPSAHPRRTLVSSFGIDGTNASIALEAHQHEDDPSATGVRDSYLLLFSAKIPVASELHMASTSGYVKRGVGVRLPDVTYTLQAGRTAFDHRRAYLMSRRLKIDLSCATMLQAEIFDGQRTTAEIYFMFPGQNSQYHGIASVLYAHQPMFRQHMDRYFAVFQRYLTVDFKASLFDGKSTRGIDQTQFTQPALFCVGYSLARTLIDLGTTSGSMIGHSLGEYVVTCVTGVFTLENTLHVIEVHGRLMQSMRPSSMMAVYLSHEQLTPWLAAERGIELAANNNAHFRVVVGEQAAISRLNTHLVEGGIQHKCLETSHTSHSAMMTPMPHDFAQLLGQVPMHAPHKRSVSNINGIWVTKEQTTSPDYWVQQARNTVLFSESAAQLLIRPALFIECRPGNTLSAFIQGHSRYGDQPTLLTLRKANAAIDDRHMLHRTLAALWIGGENTDWRRFDQTALGKHIPLPDYPFEQTYYCRYGATLSGYRQYPDPLRYPQGEWLQRVLWRMHSTSLREAFYAPNELIIIISANGDKLQQTLMSSGVDSITVPLPMSSKDDMWDNDRILAHFHDIYTLLAHKTYRQLHCLHTPGAETGSSLTRSLSELYRVARWCIHNTTPLASLIILTHGAFRIQEENNPRPTLVVLSSAVNMFVQELHPTEVRLIDISAQSSNEDLNLLAQHLVPGQKTVVALRQGVLYLQRFIPARLLVRLPLQIGYIPGNVLWVISGGKGIGRIIGRVLAQREGVHVILSSHTDYHYEAVQRDALDITHCDMTQAETIRACLATLLEHYGRLDGVIFAADATTTLTLRQLSESALRDTLTVKKRGTVSVLHTLAQRNLLGEHLLLLFCNSLAIVNAEIGQTGYATASAYLDALAQQLHTRYRVNALSVGLDALHEQGMLLDTINGSEYDVLHGLRPLITGTLLQVCKQQGVDTNYYARLSPESNWLLGEHRMPGITTLPGTGYLALAYEALHHYFVQDQICIDELVLLAPLTVMGSCSVDIFIDIPPNG